MEKTSASSLNVLYQRALEAGDRNGWEEFVRGAHDIVASTVFYTLSRWQTPQKDYLEDLVQEVFLKLCADHFALLRRFRADRPEGLIAYIRTIAASVVSDAERGRTAQKRGAGDEMLPLDEVESTAVAWESEAKIEREMLLGRVGKCLQGQRERDRQVFWLYYRHGLTAHAIASIRIIDLTSSGVESLIRRLTASVRKCLRIRQDGEIPETVKGIRP